MRPAGRVGEAFEPSSSSSSLQRASSSSSSSTLASTTLKTEPSIGRERASKPPFPSLLLLLPCCCRCCCLILRLSPLCPHFSRPPFPSPLRTGRASSFPLSRSRDRASTFAGPMASHPPPPLRGGGGGPRPKRGRGGALIGARRGRAKKRNVRGSPVLSRKKRGDRPREEGELMFFCASEAEAKERKHAQAASERAGFRFFFSPVHFVRHNLGRGFRARVKVPSSFPKGKKEEEEERLPPRR